MQALARNQPIGGTNVMRLTFESIQFYSFTEVDCVAVEFKV